MLGACPRAGGVQRDRRSTTRSTSRFVEALIDANSAKFRCAAKGSAARPPFSQSRGNANMQDRRDFLKTGFSIAAAGLAGAAMLVGARESLATEAPPETTSVRFGKYPGVCPAPIYI